MGKIIKLTFEELNEHIGMVVTEALNELNQKGIYTTPVKNRPNKVINHDVVISKAKGTKLRADDSLLNSFRNSTYLFYAKDRLNRSVFLTFHPTSIIKLLNGVAILRGDVEYDGKYLSGDIVIDFNKNRVYYHERKSRYKYDLEPDNRTKPLWDKLVSELKSSLDNTI